MQNASTSPYATDLARVHLDCVPREALTPPSPKGRWGRTKPFFSGTGLSEDRSGKDGHAGIPLARQARHAPLWALVVFAAVFALASMHFGPDASYDLRNYHLYNGFAALHGRLRLDIAPAQLQSFYAPALDIIDFVLRRTLNDRPALLDAVLALPHALAAFLALGIALRLLPPMLPGRISLAWMATLLGVTGAAGLPTLGTGMSEMLPACCLLGALMLLLDQPSEIGSGLGRVGAVGLLAGAAVGLKLTACPYAAGLAVTLLTCSERRTRAISAFLLGLGAGAGLLAGAWWWWAVWQRTGNPLFPYFNDLFGSSWGPPKRMTDTRFLPRSLEQALAYPFFWASKPGCFTTELPMRDARFALAWIGWAAVLLRTAMRRERLRRCEMSLLTFWSVSFALWEAQFSVLRYLATIELLAGIPVALALAPLLRRMRPAATAPVAFAGLVAAVMIGTIYPDWGRAQPGTAAADVRPPHFPSGSLVLLLDPAPMAYVAVFGPPYVRYVGVYNNLVRPDLDDELQRTVAQTIERHSGPLWGLEQPDANPGAADAALRFYGLERGPRCARIPSNLDGDAILACPLIASKPRPAPVFISPPASARPVCRAPPTPH